MPSEPQRPSAYPPDFLAGGGEMGERIRAFDWSHTPLGPADAWSPSLQMMVRFLLANRFPMLLWWGPEFVQIYNDAYRPILGKKHPFPGLGQPVSVCWSEIWDTLRPLIETPYRGGPATWMDDITLLINRHGFDEETHFTIAYSPVPDDSVPGGIGGVLATVNEITDKVIAERRLRALRELGAGLAEAKTAGDACRIAGEVLGGREQDVPFARLYLVDPDGSAARLAGESRNSASSEVAPATIPLGPRSSAGGPIAAALAGGGLQVMPDFQAGAGSAAPDPGVPPGSAAVIPFSGGNAEAPVGFMIVGLSSRLRFDEFYRDFLELARAQISAAIANARAYEQERARAESLAELDRAKTEFFSNISHEFRTPLTLMLGPLEGLLQPGGALVSVDTRTQLEVVQRNSLRLLKLVNNLLDFSRIEAGRLQAEFAPHDLAALTVELASVFRSAIEHAGLRLVVDCRPLPELVAVDRDMWEKIVLNLLSNAFKYTLAGEITVSLRAEGGRARLTVRDTGVGIPADELPRVFERFHRVRNSRGRTHEGTGIGLALVQELVRLHEGSIHIESVVDRGTSLVVEVPLAHARAEAPARPAAPVDGESRRWLIADQSLHSRAPFAVSPGPGDPGRPRVLWVEDNADMSDYVRHLLEETCQVVAVADGQAALEDARAHPPELVLTDIMIPRLDGFGLLRALRAEPALAGIPVILVSARAGEEARVGGAGAGADDYLTKPFSARELLARVHAHLRLFRARRGADAALRESEERFRALLTAGTHVVYRMSADWAEMTTLDGQGFLSSVTEPTRDWLRAFVPPEDQLLVRQTIAAAVAAKGLFELEHRVLRADGSVGWTFSRAVPLLGARGEIREWFGAATDVTGRKEAEQKLKRARDDALAANRAKDEFLAMLSHELRTPLNPVLLIASEAAVDPSLPAAVRADFKTISDNVALQARLIDDLLDLSRVTRGKITMENAPLDLHEVLQGAVATVGDEIRTHRIVLTLNCAARHAGVAGDPVRLRQVFWNVLKNAVKFTPPGGRIEVTSRNPPGTRDVEVLIRDTGIGMEPDELRRIFQPFVQGRHIAEAAARGGYGGLGLGLAISRMLVEVHGGSIRAESPGVQRGSMIVIRLPLRAVPAAADRPTRGGAPAERAAEAHAAGSAACRILFVEDHTPTRTAMAGLLARRGFEVEPVQSMSEALAHYRSSRFDLLISDIGLPDGDGCSLMVELRRSQPSLAGIAISGYGMDDDLERSRAAGFAEHLTKPIGIDSLERALHRLMEKQSGS